MFIALFGAFSCSSANLDYVKEKGVEKWREAGFEPVGYQGYQWGFGGMGGYGGAKVWWKLKKKSDPGVTYSGYIQRWGSELRVYGPMVVDKKDPANQSFVSMK